MEAQTIDLAIPATGAYRRWAEVTAKSAVRESSLPVRIHYLDWDFLAQRGIGRERLEALGNWHGSSIPFSRLFLAELFPDLNWVISCDADVLFRGDIAKLWALRDDAVSIVASQDHPFPGEPLRRLPFQWYDAKGLDFKDPRQYFCDGLCLCNLKRWRERGLQTKFLALAEKYDDWPSPDQMIINYVLQNDSKLLPLQWGCFSGDANEEVDYDGDCAIHFVSDMPWRRTKPTQLMNDAVVLWRKMAGMPFGGWRRWLFLVLRKTRGVWSWNTWMSRHFRNVWPRHPLPRSQRKVLIIWAHSGCRSTAAVYHEACKLARNEGYTTFICQWGLLQMPPNRSMKLDDAIVIGDDLQKGRAVLKRFGGKGTVHVFCVYQNSTVWRRLITEAKCGGARVVINAEAPCEMCMGLRAVFKRLYYYWVLPMKLRKVVKTADLFISSSGKKGIDRLMRLGWPREKIVPFGYASPRLVISGQWLVVSEDGEKVARGQRFVVSEGERLRKLAEKKVGEWLDGVTQESFCAALDKLVDEMNRANVYRFKRVGDRERAMDGARKFFDEFSRKIVKLSDGRCVYFAPDARSKARNEGDLSRCWAEYAFHAVSSSGKIIDGRNYRERLFNSAKLDAMTGICEIISQEHCMYRLIDAVPQNDAVIFIGKDAFGGRTEVVTRLDEYGNAKANLGEVTVIVRHKRNKQTPPPKFRPLTEVVETVAKHQAAGFSPSTTVNSLANPIAPRKGEKVAGGQRLVVSGTQTSLRVLHLGSEAAYRGVKVAEEAARMAGVELVKTGGKMSEEELVREIHRADLVLGCGYCEPWGMRINDVLLEGTPIIVSDGMGAAVVCDWYGCGCVVPKGDAQALAAVLSRCKAEPEFLAKLRSGAQVAARELLPENRAKVWFEHVVGRR